MTKRKRQQIEENFNNNNNETNKKSKINHEDKSYEKTEIEIDSSFEEKKEEFILTREVAEHTIVKDITGNQWRIGAPVGRGAFGEIFLASDDISRSVNIKTAQYVTKVEPHSNGPLFVEIHCLMNVNKKSEEDESENQQNISLTQDVGIPRYIASGSHFFNDSRYRFLIMPRYKTDLHSIIKTGRLSKKHFLIIASQIIDVLMHLHNRNYVHSDIKAENIMLGSCEGLDSSSLSPSGRSRRKTNVITYAAIDDFARYSRTPESDESEGSDDDEDFQLSPKKRKAKKAAKRSTKKSPKSKAKSSFKNLKEDQIVDEITSDDRVYMIDYGLATKFVNSTGDHKPFCCDERRAHDGTLEFTSRDAHFGAHSRRSDLECLGFNLIYWSQGFLPWKDEKLKEQPEIVHRMKEVFMTDVKEMIKLLYGKEAPKYLADFMLYVKGLEFDEEPDYDYLKGLFEKEFAKLGLKKSEMKLNIGEMKSECKENVKTESDLMISTITDVKTARKLGFLIATDAVDGIDIQTKSNDSIHKLNSSCKVSPKNLRSKEKTKVVKGRKQKRQSKLTDKEVVIEKMAQGKKLSIAEIAILDPEQMARDRADREYEKFEEKNQNLTPIKYAGNPTYAIIEIETKLKIRASGNFISSAISNSNLNGDVESSKKSTVDSNAKNLIMNIEPKSSATAPVKNQAMINVIKTKTKATTSKRGRKNRKSPKKSATPIKEPQVEDVAVSEEIQVEPIPVPTNKRRRGRPAKKSAPAPPELDEVSDEVAEDFVQVPEPIPEQTNKRKRARQPKATAPVAAKAIVEVPDTEEEEASVYYDIPGEGSNDSIKDISEDENQPKIFAAKRQRNVIHDDEDSNTGSVLSAASSRDTTDKPRGRYEFDDDFDLSLEDDEESVVSEVSEATTESFKPKRPKQKNRNGKSRSTSRSANFKELDEDSDEQSESELPDNDSEFIQEDETDEESVEDQGVEFDDDDDEEEEDEELESDGEESELAYDESNDSNDSIDIKYSPIKTRNARRTFHTKQIRGRRMDDIDEDTRNFRSIVSTQG